MVETRLALCRKRPVKNSIGAVEHTWEEMVVLTGFLDLSNGDSKHTTYNAKVPESTHFFYATIGRLTCTGASENDYRWKGL